MKVCSSTYSVTCNPMCASDPELPVDNPLRHQHLDIACALLSSYSTMPYTLTFLSVAQRHLQKRLSVRTASQMLELGMRQPVQPDTTHSSCSLADPVDV